MHDALKYEIADMLTMCATMLEFEENLTKRDVEFIALKLDAITFVMRNQVEGPF